LGFLTVTLLLALLLVLLFLLVLLLLVLFLFLLSLFAFLLLLLLVLLRGNQFDAIVLARGDVGLGEVAGVARFQPVFQLHARNQLEGWIVGVLQLGQVHCVLVLDAQGEAAVR